LRDYSLSICYYNSVFIFKWINNLYYRYNKVFKINIYKVI